MSLIIILIAFYFDYKAKPNTFLTDLKGGLFIFLMFIINATVLKYIFGFGYLFIIFFIGIEIILLFVIKGLLQK